MQPFNLSCCRVIGSAVFAFIVFNNVLLWLLKGVAMDVNCLSNSGQEGGERTQPGLACRPIIMRSTDRRMLCSWCSANRPSMSAVAVSHACRVTAGHSGLHYHCLPYSSPVSPDVDVCCVAGWRLMFEIMRTRCLSDNIVLGVLPTKNIGPISIRPNMANIAQYPISQYQYRSNPTDLPAHCWATSVV